MNLKPCPFCGCENIIEKKIRIGARLYCVNCKVGFISAKPGRSWSYEEQIEMLEIMEINWNRRYEDE